MAEVVQLLAAGIASPARSTLPLLDYWREPSARLEQIGRLLGVTLAPDATLCFEHPVQVAKGRGKASFTDLMITTTDVAVAIEAKFTEPPYEYVETWLGDEASQNRKDVIDGWLGLIHQATGRSLERADVSRLPYQLIHRTASCCATPARRRFVVYQVFRATDIAHYRETLGDLQALLPQSETLAFAVLVSAAKPTPKQVELQNHWRASGTVGDQILQAMLTSHLFEFEDTSVVFP
jgi:hypothetical protein